MLILVSWKVDFFGLGKEAGKYVLGNGNEEYPFGKKTGREGKAFDDRNCQNPRNDIGQSFHG